MARAGFSAILSILLAGSVFGLAAAPASASQSIFDFFGSAGSGAGQFAAGIKAVEREEEAGAAGIAVNDSSGDVYVADRSDNRIEQFDSEDNFIRAWGIDTISGGASGTGNLTSGSATVTSVITTSRAFVMGQEISGTGIPTGTTITKVTTGSGVASQLTLSQNATGNGSGVALSAAEGIGNVAQNEIQTVSIDASSGNFQLTFKTTSPTAEATTANIAYNALPSAVETALKALPNIGAGNVAVSGSEGGPYTVEFIGTRFADTNVTQLAPAPGSPPLAGPGKILIATSTEGAGRFEKCTVATSCQAGTPTGIAGGVGLPNGVAVDQSSGNVYVSDEENLRVDEFDPSGTFIRAFGGNVVESGPDNTSEAQTFGINASSGTFTLKFEGQSTAALPYNVPASGGVGPTASVENALNALSTIGGAGGSVSVSGGPGGPGNPPPYRVTFGGGTLANKDVPELQLTINGVLTSTNTIGAQAEICNAGADACRTGEDGTEGGLFGSEPAGNRFEGYLAVAPGGPYAGDLFVGDNRNGRMQIFAPNGTFVGAFGTNVLKSGPETAGKRLCLAALGDVCQKGQTGGGPNAYGFYGNGGPFTWHFPPTRFAIGPDGSVYVPNFTHLQKYSPDLTSEHDFATATCSREKQEEYCRDIAVDPNTGDVYVTFGIPGTEEVESPFGGTITVSIIKEVGLARYDAAGDAIETALEGSEVKPTGGIAIDGSTGNLRSGRVYFSSRTPEQRIDVLGEPTAPDVEFDKVNPEGLQPHSAELSGTIDPNGNKLHTTYRFETRFAGGIWTPYPVPDTDLGNGTEAVAIEETIPGLRANTAYEVRLTAFKGQVFRTPVQTFTTPPVGPDVQTGAAQWSSPPETGPSLTFSGRIDTNNLAVHYYFEYGTDTSYGKRVPIFETAVHPGSQEAFIARQTVDGLDPEGTYHYRLIARSASGTTEGLDREVEPSETGLRYPELVTPVEKGSGTAGGYIPFAQFKWQAALDGGGLLFPFQNGGPDATAGGEVRDIATRDPLTGWHSSQLSPPSTSPPVGSFLEAGLVGIVQFQSPDLSCGFIQSHGKLTADTPQADVDAGLEHLYRRDNSDGSYTLITPNLLSSGGQFIGRYVVTGASANCDRVLFMSHYKLLAGLPGPEGGTHAYEWESGGGPNGTLRSADVRPDGSIPDEGALGGGSFIGGGGKASINSASGPGLSHVFFSAGSNEGADTGQRAVFVRENHTTTIDVSQSQTAAPNDGPTNYQIASADGSHVFFTARYGLAANGTSSGTTTSCAENTAGGCDLYDYDLESEELTDLTPDANPADSEGAKVIGVFGTSADGSYVYFAAQGQLIRGQGRTFAQNNAEKADASNIYLAHEGTLSFVGTLRKETDDSLGQSQFVGHSLSYMSQVTPSGLYLLFRSKANITGYDSGGKNELYRYSAPEEETVCISCRPDELPAKTTGHFLVPNPASEVYFVHSISSDGRRVFFSTGDALTPGAEEFTANAEEEKGTGNNAYEWHNGFLHLLASPGEFIDSSPDGSNVFVWTTRALVPQDQDSQLDFYDLRIDGGFPYTQPEPCDPLAENSCQGTPPAPPPPSADPASARVNGPGNPPLPAAHRKPKKHQKKRHKHKSHKRAAKHNSGRSK